MPVTVMTAFRTPATPYSLNLDKPIRYRARITAQRETEQCQERDLQEWHKVRVAKRPRQWPRQRNTQQPHRRARK